MFVHLQALIFAFGALEARCFDADGVIADAQEGDQIVAAVIGGGLAGNICSLGNNRDLGTCHHGSGIVGDRAGETPCCLTEQQGTGRKQE